MDLNIVLVRPLVTEKGTDRVEEENIYPFAVHSQAKKEDIRKAVEHLYKVKVLRVNTLVRPGKPRRLRYRLGTTKGWKLAFVKLAENNRIDIF